MSAPDTSAADDLTALFPATPYNFDLPTPQSSVGPIKALLVAIGMTVAQLRAAIVVLESQTTVQTATGAFLDAHGVLYQTPRLVGELDPSYRARILTAINAGAGTIPAIQAAANAYLASQTATAGLPRLTAVVYDLQSDPGRCAADAAAGQVIVMFDFVISLAGTINEDDLPFADYCYADFKNACLFAPGTYYSDDRTQTNGGLIGAVRGRKAANTFPRFETIISVDTSDVTGGADE